MGTRALAALFLAPSLALAQSAGQATLSVVGRTTFDTTEINRTECPSTTATVQVSYLPAMSGTFTAGSDQYKFFASTSACSTTLPTSGSFASDVTATDNLNVQTLTVSVSALRTALTSISCTNANDQTYYVCVYLVNTSPTVVGTAFSGALTFQTAVPPVPVITGHAPGNAAIEVTVAQGTTTATATATSGITFQATASATGQTTVTAPNPPGTSTTIRLEGLANTIEYTVVADAFSSAGNDSGPSAPPIYETPLPFESFWQAYQNAGGREQGGCGGDAGALSLLALIPLALHRRRR